MTQHGKGRNHSELDEHSETIIRLRKTGLSWNAINKLIGYPTTTQNLHKWARRRELR